MAAEASSRLCGAIEENDAGELHDRHVHRPLAKPRSRSEADTSSEARLFRSGECT